VVWSFSDRKIGAFLLKVILNYRDRKMDFRDRIKKKKWLLEAPLSELKIRTLVKMEAKGMITKGLQNFISLVF